MLDIFEEGNNFNNSKRGACYMSPLLFIPTLIKVKSSRLFPLSYLFQKNQYKCDIVPSLPTGLCGIEPVEYVPI